MNDNNNPETLKYKLPNERGITRRKISNENELPDWFNKKNYHESGNFSALDWYKELNTRSLYYSIADVFSDVDVFYNSGTERDYRTRVSYFGTRTIPCDEKKELINFAVNTCEYVCIEKSEVVFTSIISNDKFFNNILSPKEPVFNLGLTVCYKDSFEFNLLTPDNILIELYLKEYGKSIVDDEFISWLLNQRKDMISKVNLVRSPFEKQVITKKFKVMRLTDKKIYGYYECGLLPFLDLHQWSLINNIKICHDLLGRSILPIPAKDTGISRIEENTITKAENIIPIIEVLWNQITFDGKTVKGKH